MYQRILVPLDGSKLAEQAVYYAEEIAKRFRGEVVLLTTFVLGDGLKRPSKTYMEEKAEELQSSGIRASLMYFQGDPATKILNFAENNDIDLIVISSHGCTGDRCWPLGSIANKVVQKSNILTLLVRPSEPGETRTKKDMRKILLALDGSRVAEYIIPYVENLARNMGSEVILFRTVEPITIPFETSYRYREEYEVSFLANAEKEAETYLSGQENAIRDKGIKVRSALVRGKADQAILKYAEDKSVSLIALTTHGFSGIAKWAYGSVAARIIEGSSRPVLLMRPPLPTSEE